MIKSDKGNVFIKGSTNAVLADLAVAISSVEEMLVEEYGADVATILVDHTINQVREEGMDDERITNNY